MAAVLGQMADDHFGRGFGYMAMMAKKPQNVSPSNLQLQLPNWAFSR